MSGKAIFSQLAGSRQRAGGWGLGQAKYLQIFVRSTTIAIFVLKFANICPMPRAGPRIGARVKRYRLRNLKISISFWGHLRVKKFCQASNLVGSIIGLGDFGAQ